MRKILFAIGSVAMVLTLASCDNSVSFETVSPGAPRNVEVGIVTTGTGDTAQRWALLTWDAAVNSDGFEVFIRRDNGQPQSVAVSWWWDLGGWYPGCVSRGVWTYTPPGGTGILGWHTRSGPTTQRWSYATRIDNVGEVMWRGEVQLGVRADRQLGAANVTSAPSGIVWGGTVTTTGSGAGW